ncbi:hypothetical protein B5F78_12140 [Bacteroides sp. An279]|nr:hypothetical protein B5F78_12140 [Bacteroides sp. An279]OUP29962.1 hypothetical protein B5F25_15510 [Bacteroides sp. An19]
MIRKTALYLPYHRSGNGPKTAQSTHDNEYIKTRKTFWRNSKRFLITDMLILSIKFIFSQSNFSTTMQYIN